MDVSMRVYVSMCGACVRNNESSVIIISMTRRYACVNACVWKVHYVAGRQMNVSSSLPAVATTRRYGELVSTTFEEHRNHPCVLTNMKSHWQLCNVVQRGHVSVSESLSVCVSVSLSTF